MDDSKTLIHDLLEKLQPLARPWWKPETADEDGLVTSSKFSGTPWLAADESWPTCPNCGKPQQLFVQLNTQELPAALQGSFGSGLIQLFYCTNPDPLCEVDCEAYFPFSKAVLARRIVPAGEAASLTPPQGAFAPKRITGWAQMGEELPGCSASEGWCKAQGRPLNEVESEVLWDDENFEHFSAESGDKIGGWPHWVQDPEYPNCKLCRQPMALVMQIDSEDHLPYMFGDVGCGHLTQCPEHKDVLAFAWACG